MDSVFKLFLPVFIYECLGFILHKHSGFSSLLWSICSVPQVCDITKLVYRFLLFFSGIWLCLVSGLLYLSCSEIPVRDCWPLLVSNTSLDCSLCLFFFVFFLPVSMFLPVPIFLLCCYFCDCPFTFDFLLLKNPAFASYLWVRFMTIWFTKCNISLFFHFRECSIVVSIFMHLYWLSNLGKNSCPLMWHIQLSPNIPINREKIEKRRMYAIFFRIQARRVLQKLFIL